MEDCSKTKKYLGYDLGRGGLNKFEACADVKAEMKKLPMRVQMVAKLVSLTVIPAKPNDLVSLNISTIRAPKG